MPQSVFIDPAALPIGWEAIKTPDNRVFYINHTYKTTLWTLPVQ
jgi:hypothetical protein